MKRFHVHVAVNDLAESVRFYSSVFGAEPTVRHDDYAKSDKYWVTDPQGIAWETFHTLASIPVFGDEPAAPSTELACCTPPAPSASKDAGPCGVPKAALIGKSCCAG